MDCLLGSTWIFFDGNFVDACELMEIAEYSEAGTQSGIQSLYVWWSFGLWVFLARPGSNESRLEEDMMG